MKKTYYIKIQGYCDAVLAVYKIEANSFVKALEIAKNKYLQELDFDSATEEEYHEFQEENGEDDEDDGENDFDGCCPYCHSGNTDFVDSDEDSTKYICRDCNEDFIVHNDGRITTRNGFPINNESEEE